MKIEIDTKDPEDVRNAIKILSALLEEKKEENFSVNEESGSAFGNMFSDESESSSTPSEPEKQEEDEKPRVIQY